LQTGFALALAVRFGHAEPIRLEQSEKSPCAEDPARFASLGYCVFRNGIPAGDVGRYSNLLEATMEAGEWKGEPHYYSEEWRTLCCHPRILDAVETILGPEIVLFFSSVLLKRPNDKIRSPWHQDNTYWKSIHGTDVVTVWLALDDVDEGNSCMQVIPRSHEGYEVLKTRYLEKETNVMLRLEVDVTPDMESAAVPICLHAGEFSIHDSFIIHGSGPNHSDRRRAGYTIRYGNALTTEIDQEEHTFGQHPVLPVYYVRGSGEGLREGYVDLRGCDPL
jgi:hypothetical protein